MFQTGWVTKKGLKNFLKNSEVLKAQLKFVSVVLTHEQIKSEFTWIVGIIFEHLNSRSGGFGFSEATQDF